MTTSPVSRHRRHDAMRWFRYLYRVPWLLLHFLVAIGIAIFIITTSRNAVARDGVEPAAHRLIRWWARVLLRIFGFRSRTFGTPMPDAAMFVCNHVTWMDIVSMYSQRAVCFVSKAEISHWPIIGWLAASAGTIFHQRGSTESLATVMQTMVARMQGGRSVAVFPEGGTSRGHKLRVFHARIFQAGLDAGVPIQPVALRYAENGERWLDVAFRPKESFIGNIIRVLGEPTRVAEAHFLPIVPPDPTGRRHMADAARAEIEAVLDVNSGA